jgi:hypothetical protein
MVWAEAANCATDLDCLVVRKNGQRTPFEIFYGKSADYGPHLRTFGEVGVTHNITTVKEKLQDRGHACIFVGYAAQHAGKKSGRLCVAHYRMCLEATFCWCHVQHAAQPVLKEAEVLMPDKQDDDVDPLHLSNREELTPTAKELIL